MRLARLGREIGGADHRRLHRAGMLAEIVGRGGRRGAAAAGAAAGSRRGGDRRRGAPSGRPGDADAPLAVGQLDLAEVGLVEDLPPACGRTRYPSRILPWRNAPE